MRVTSVKGLFQQVLASPARDIQTLIQQKDIQTLTLILLNSTNKTKQNKTTQMNY